MVASEGETTVSDLLSCQTGYGMEPLLSGDEAATLWISLTLHLALMGVYVALVKGWWLPPA